MHLKETTGGKGNWNFPAIGDGSVDFGRVLQILRDAGYSGPLSVEIEFGGEPWPPLAEVDAAMKRSYEHLTALGNRLAVGRSVYMPEMTNLQVREYLEGGGRTVIVPVGSTEDHGDHGPLWTDVYIPLEVAKRAAPQLNAIVGPPIPFGLAADHRGAHGLVQVRMDTFLDLVRDVCMSLADVGFRRIVLLNGHYCNSHALEFASSRIHDELPEGTRLYPFPYWAGLKPEEAEQYLSGSVGIHANVGETSIVLAIDENLCDMERVRDFTPELPELRTSALALIDPVFLSTPGSFWSILEEGGGVWGKPSESTAEKGEEFLGWCTRAVVDFFQRPRGHARPDRAGVPEDATVAVVASTLAIIGAGFMGSAHAANYAALGDRVRVKTVCGRSPERAARVAETVGASTRHGSRRGLRGPGGRGGRHLPADAGASRGRRASVRRRQARVPREAARPHGGGRRGDRRGRRAQRQAVHGRAGPALLA